MRSTLKYVSVLCAAASLLACADTGYYTVADSAPLPSFGSADNAYRIGRGQHLALRFDEAITSYQAALKAEPLHINARNGLATLYAERGQFDKAIPLWQALTAETQEQAGPQTAFLFSNLGYAQFLSGAYEQALGSLEKACLLDPLNHRAWQHLGSALDKLGQHERAQQMYKQSAALQQHDFKADYALAPKAGIAAIDSAVAADVNDEQQWASTEVRQGADGMFVMQRVPARSEAPARIAATRGPVAPIVPANVTPGAGTLVEIRNGNGITGMARALANEIGAADVKVVRLTNQKGYDVRLTRVEYQPEFRVAAERLAERFGAATVVAVDDVGRADVRLVIGHDLAVRKGLGLTVAQRAAPPRKEG